MSRKRDPARDEAKRIWLESGKKITLKEIANQLGKPPNRIRKWKSEDNWDGENNKPEKERFKGSAPNGQKERSYSKGTQDSENVTNLTPQQELFAQLVGGKQIPLYRAYLIAYKESKPTLSTAMTNGSRLASKSNIASRITKISEETARHHDLSLDSVVNDYVFLRDESKASIVADGVHKANADAFSKSLDSLARLLKLDPIIAEEYRNKKADADINEFDAKQQLHPEDIDNDAGDSYINAIDQGIHQIFKKEDGDSE